MDFAHTYPFLNQKKCLAYRENGQVFHDYRGERLTDTHLKEVQFFRQIL